MWSETSNLNAYCAMLTVSVWARSSLYLAEIIVAGVSENQHDLLALTADIVSAHVANNKVEAGHVATLIQNVHEALTGLTAPKVEETPKAEPAVSIRASLKHDYIVCLEDGKKLKMLKRYLRTNYNMTPEEYRNKWSLPRDYPMIAPAYAEQRRGLAKSLGLGRKKAVEVVEAVAKPAKRAAKSVSDGLAAAREHLGSEHQKVPTKPRVTKAEKAAAPAE
jgi:predicted transcriptional regulator